VRVFVVAVLAAVALAAVAVADGVGELVAAQAPADGGRARAVAADTVLRDGTTDAAGRISAGRISAGCVAAAAVRRAADGEPAAQVAVASRGLDAIAHAIGRRRHVAVLEGAKDGDHADADDHGHDDPLDRRHPSIPPRSLHPRLSISMITTVTSSPS